MATVEKFVKLGGKVGMSTVRDKIGIPDPGKDEELLAAPREHAAGTLPAELAQVGELMARGATFDQAVAALATARPRVHRHAADAVDNTVDDMLSDWQPLVVPIIAGLEGKLAAATSLAEAEAVLRAHLATMSADDLQDALARAFFAARLAGEAGHDL